MNCINLLNMQGPNDKINSNIIKGPAIVDNIVVSQGDLLYQLLNQLWEPRNDFSLASSLFLSFVIDFLITPV